MRYDSTLMDADFPYLLDTGAGEIAELPPHWSLDDWEQYGFLPRPHIGGIITSPLTVAEMWIHELDAMRRHGSLDRGGAGTRRCTVLHLFTGGRSGALGR